jgi:hypothetical protein
VSAALGQTEYELQLLRNFEEHHSFGYTALFSIQICCLCVKIAEVIQFHNEIGPLLKIVGKMGSDFLNFLTIYIILIIMFAIIGNINFFLYVEEFNSLFTSLVTVLDASMGNFEFALFESIDDPEQKILKNAGAVYIFLTVLIFTILILNLIIAILSNTYNLFSGKSAGLYLSKILSQRDSSSYDENFGTFLSALTPLNFVLIPFVPYGMWTQDNPVFNTRIMKLQYVVFMLIMFSLFVVVSLVLLPTAFLQSVLRKLQQIFKAKTTIQQIMGILYFMSFCILGLPIMLLTFLADCWYFWEDNFRSDLKKIVIEKEPSTINKNSIMKIKMLC